MKIVMFTNTFLPHVGGVAESVGRFATAFRDRGDRVLVVAPWMEGDHEDEPGVIRVPALENIGNSDFSLPLPIPGVLSSRIAAFSPDVVHSHHPFLLGDTALRTAAVHDVPIVFTNHTRYDIYTHYLPWDSSAVRRFATRLAAGYANLCDAVIAPSGSIRSRLIEAGVRNRIEVIPTGIDAQLFGGGDGGRFRRAAGIPETAFLIGHVGRLATEKNLDCLSRLAARFVAGSPDRWLLVAGRGPCERLFDDAFAERGGAERYRKHGVLSPGDLADAYAAMDAFVFTSVSETQGMVLVESMAAGTPVVAFDSPGVRDLVADKKNGRLIPLDDREGFLAALEELQQQDAQQKQAMRRAARQTASRYAMPLCAERLMDLYSSLLNDSTRQRRPHDAWHETLRAVAQECRILSNVIEAGSRAAWGP